jgi:hypothetical protein
VLIVAAQLITYDLQRPGQNYPELFEAIKALGSWWHCLDSTWIVDSSLSSEEILDRLRPHFDGNDKMLVVPLAYGWSTWGLDKECTDWLRQHVAR